MVKSPASAMLLQFPLHFGISIFLNLQDAINSASSFTQSLSRDLVEGQQKLLALAAAGANQGAQNPLHSQRSNVPLLHEKVSYVDPCARKRLSLSLYSFILLLITATIILRSSSG